MTRKLVTMKKSKKNESQDGIVNRIRNVIGLMRIICFAITKPFTHKIILSHQLTGSRKKTN